MPKPHNIYLNRTYKMIAAENLEISNDIVVLCSLQTATAQTSKENAAMSRLFRCMTHEVLQGDLADLGVLVTQERKEL